MNFIVRAKDLAHRRNALIGHLSLTVLQQCNLYSTRYTRNTKKVEEITLPVPDNPPVAPSSFSHRVIKQKDDSVCPKPVEIPFQAKIANFVNLIGHVEIPVRLETSCDSKHFATTVISLAGKKPISIPIVFEGDLAHAVALHVKKNDCVFISGQLSLNSVEFVVNESFGKFHILADNLNFIDTTDNKAFVKKVKAPSVDLQHEPDANFNLEPVKEKVILQAKVDITKKHDPDEIIGLWRDLVKNSLQWFDYRSHKANGLVNARFPDFKQKVTGNGLWISSAPKWVLPGIETLEFDVKIMKLKQGNEELKADVKKSNFSGNEDWRSLIENPDKWWDNREGKRNPKYPDFKHKENGVGLWLDKIPEWAVSKLPKTKQSRVVDDNPISW